jgi:hypothetical protein
VTWPLRPPPSRPAQHKTNASSDFGAAGHGEGKGKGKGGNRGRGGLGMTSAQLDKMMTVRYSNGSLTAL